MTLAGALFSIVMVGHSLFGTTGPTMLEQALNAGGAEAEVQAQIINGAPLRYNWDESDRAQGIDAREVLPRGQTSHLILTEALPLDNHVRWSDSGGYARAFADIAKAANPDIKVYVQETWHSLKSGTGQAIEYDEKADIDWRLRLSQDLPVWKQIAADINLGKSGDARIDVALIPAGQAMAHLYDGIETGRITQVASIDALFDDDIHLNDIGHYFVAMVQYATLTGRSPVGLPTDFKDRFGKAFDMPSTEFAGVLQQIAWEAVQIYQGAEITPAPFPPVAAREQTAPAALTGPPVKLEVGKNDAGIGLAPVADWSTQVPFIDLMKTSRPWIGHLPNRWGGMEYEELAVLAELDENGWPTVMPDTLGSIGTLILTDMPEAATSLAGRYVLRYEGQGAVEVSGRVERVRYRDGEVTFSYTPGPGMVEIRLQRIDHDDPIRNITVVHEDNLAAFDAGMTFNPKWLDRIAPFKALRFMDWTETNNSELSDWADRPMVGDVTYAPGVPVEVLVDLANTLETDGWFNIPHLADDAFVRAYAELVHARLDPGRTAYVEFSNEVWNWQFAQARWADAQARARWGQDDKWMQYYGLRAAEVARIWSDVFADDPSRLVNVISTQTAWLGLETEALEAPLLVAEGGRAPKEAFDGYAVSGYFGGVLGLEDRAPMVRGWLADSLRAAEEQAALEGLTGVEAANFITARRYDLANELAAKELLDGAVSGDQSDTLFDLIGRVWPYHSEVAVATGLDLLMYEGGTHAVGLGPMVEDEELSRFLHQFNYSLEMGELYEALLIGWCGVGGKLFNHYADVQAPTKWGSWGALRHLDDSNPRWDALVRLQ